MGVVVPPGISAGKTGHQRNGPVPETPKPIREGRAPDQGTSACQDQHGQGGPAESGKDVFDDSTHSGSSFFRGRDDPAALRKMYALLPGVL